MTEFIEAAGNVAMALIAPFATLISIGADLNFLYLGGGLLLAAIYYACSKGFREGAGSFLSFMFPKQIYLSASAILDYKYYYCLLLLRGFYIGVFLIGTSLSAELLVKGLTLAFGSAGKLDAPLWLAMALVTVVEVLLFELGYWVAHRLLHEIPLLWEFHKTHHSATVLTPATEARLHPVDDLVVGNITAIFAGIGLGSMHYLLGEAAQAATLFGANVIFVAYLVSYFHLRHTHVWVAFTGWLGHVAQSPAHHQCHHSANPRHFGTNLGYGLVCWDWLFGTLHVPCDADRENFSFGIGEESADYRSVADLFLLPFGKAARLYKPRAKERSPSPVADAATV